MCRHGHKATIFCLGDFFPEALRNEVVEVRLLRVGYFRLRRGLGKLCECLREYQVDVLHAYNPTAYIYARFASAICGVPVVLTKPGGPTIKSSYYPLAKDIIVNSADDESVFLGNQRFSKSRISLFPNRVDEPVHRVGRVEELLALLAPNLFSILAISRITESKRLLFVQILNLADEFRRRSIQFQLIIIGTPDSQMVKDYIEGRLGSESKLLTDLPFTEKSADYIPAVDCVLGMGRVVMEAAACSKPVLVPDCQSNYPRVLDGTSFDAGFCANFTERASYPKVAAGDALEILERLARVPGQREGVGTYLRQRFVEDFLIDSIVAKQVGVYENAVIESKMFTFDQLSHVFDYFFVAVLRLWRRKVRHKLFSGNPHSINNE